MIRATGEENCGAWFRWYQSRTPGLLPQRSRSFQALSRLFYPNLIHVAPWRMTDVFGEHPGKVVFGPAEDLIRSCEHFMRTNNVQRLHPGEGDDRDGMWSGHMTIIRRVLPGVNDLSSTF